MLSASVPCSISEFSAFHLVICLLKISTMCHLLEASFSKFRLGVVLVLNKRTSRTVAVERFQTLGSISLLCNLCVVPCSLGPTHYHWGWQQLYWCILTHGKSKNLSNRMSLISQGSIKGSKGDRDLKSKAYRTSQVIYLGSSQSDLKMPAFQAEIKCRRSGGIMWN